jgi:hypothetical protein
MLMRQITCCDSPESLLVEEEEVLVVVVDLASRPTTYEIEEKGRSYELLALFLLMPFFDCFVASGLGGT